MATLEREEPFRYSLSAKRPCLIVLLAFIPGILISYGTLHDALPIYCSLLFLPLVIAVMFFRQPAMRMTVTLITVGLAGLLFANRALHDPRPNHINNLAEPDMYCELAGIIEDDPKVKHLDDGKGNDQKIRVSFTMYVERLSSDDGWKPACGKVRVQHYSRDKTELSIGDSIEIKGILRQPGLPRNPGAFDYRRYLRHRGIKLILYSSEDEELRVVKKKSGSIFRRILFESRQALHNQIAKSKVSPRVKQLQYAMLLGERQEIDPELKQKLIDTNTIHILAISGLHVGILMVFVVTLLRFFLIPKTIISLAAIGAALWYALMTGFNPPAVRALVIGTTILMAPIVRRYSDNLNSLALAALILLLINPLALFQPGFQLSFTVVLSIMLLTNRINDFLIRALGLKIDPGFVVIGPTRRIIYRYFNPPIRVFSASLSAFLGALPLVALFYHQINPISFVSNLFVVPLVGMFVPATLFRLGLGSFLFSLGFVFDFICNFFGSAIIFFIELFSRLKVFSMQVQAPSPQMILFYYALLLAVGLTPRLKRSLKYLAATGIAILITFAIMHFTHSRNYVDVVFLDVSHGESIFIETSGGKTLLIDGGSLSQNIGNRVLLPFLRHRGIKKLDYLLITHFNADHYNGLAEVVRKVPIGEILWRPIVNFPTDPALDELFSEIKSREISTRELEVGDVVKIGRAVRFRILNPDKKLLAAGTLSENNSSIVAKLSFGNSSLLLTGDIESGTEYLLMKEDPNLKSTVLKVPHHGSTTSSSAGFIETVDPKAAVVCCRRFGKKSAGFSEVMQRYLRRDVEVFRTDTGGAIRMKMYPDRIRLIPMIPY